MELILIKAALLLLLNSDNITNIIWFLLSSLKTHIDTNNQNPYILCSLFIALTS